MDKKRLLPLAVVCVIAAGVAGCGSSASSSSGSSAAASKGSSGIAVPQNIKAKQTIVVGSDLTYPPFDFYKTGSQVAIGIDIDIANAIAQQLGLSFSFANGSFDTLIPGLQAHRYDMLMAAMYDNRQREQAVMFVDYYSAGVGFLDRRGGPSFTSYSALCGYTVAVQRGTSEQAALQSQKAKCGNKPLKLLVVADQPTANLDVQSHRADVTAVDAPLAGYEAKLSKGEFQAAGYTASKTPYGIALPKDSKFAPALKAALQKIIANGTYKAILKKWGVEAGGITQPTIDGAVS